MAIEPFKEGGVKPPYGLFIHDLNLGTRKAEAAARTTELTCYHEAMLQNELIMNDEPYGMA